MEVDAAVEVVCTLGRKLEKDLAHAEEAKEAERELRKWKPMPNGGHDPEFRPHPLPAEPVRGVSETGNPAGTMHKSDSVLSDQSEK